jgi:hypothetical protein
MDTRFAGVQHSVQSNNNKRKRKKKEKGDTMANSRDIFALGGERQPAGGDPPAPLWRAPMDNDDISWEQLNRNDASAPNVAE